MIKKIGCNSKKREENKRQHPGDFIFVFALTVYKINYKTERKGKATSQVDFKVFIQF